MPFLLLTAVEVTRSVNFFGVSTFIELYWLQHLGAGHLAAGTALTCFMVGGVTGTLLGGRVADRFGLTRTILVGNAAAIPALIALRISDDVTSALLAAVAAVPAVLLSLLLPSPRPTGPAGSAPAEVGRV